MEYKIFNKNNKLHNISAHKAMIKTVVKASEVFREDWNSLMGVTNYIFTGYYGRGVLTMIAARQNQNFCDYL